MAALIQHKDAFLYATMPVASEPRGNRHSNRAGSFIIWERTQKLAG
jgi:hypothetical protein